MQLLSVVIPVYNEGEHIAATLESLVPNIPADSQVMVVYDFDGDNTIPVVQRIRDALPCKVTLLKNDLGRGVLNALKAGFAAATGRFVFVMMADLSDPPEIIPVMLDKAEKENLDVVCASRFMPGGTHEGGPWLKNLLSKTAGLSLWYLTSMPTHDATNNFKLYSRKFLDSVTIESQGGFEIALELTVKAWQNGWNVGEVPSSWKERSSGKSNFRLWKWLPYYLKWYFKALFGRRRPQKCSAEKIGM
ncbi:MAG TPA: glycosyltransferase family 2 protein [Lentisphaeria bacterium]|nr:glycosyltransferase family 2 protein [Lentisphaerota bacterium]OQC17054.1 MAG: Undecaprenyl-phosphate mannosyltransferase [Lentisphaerae bacterium ADurb.Bin082]HPY89508.1 glycosyltransferase family 2 protein [Lentisphaeria bacterium]HQL86040.1 glycosyltransferase family 2 protein [Lentisphaeria bacterium]